MQTAALKHRLTAAQQRRRAERIARRKRVYAAPVAAPRIRFVDRLKAMGRALLRKERRANREKAEALAGQVARNKELLRLRSALTDRCTYQHVREVEQKHGRKVTVVGAPCGGRLKTHRRERDGEPRELRCQVCGRVYQDERRDDDAAA